MEIWPYKCNAHITEPLTELVEVQVKYDAMPQNIPFPLTFGMYNVDNGKSIIIKIV